VIPDPKAYRGRLDRRDRLVLLVQTRPYPAQPGQMEESVTLDPQELQGLKATLDRQEREALQEIKALRATRALLDRLVPMDLLDPKVQREILETLGLPEPMVQQALTAVRDHRANRVQ
jgi:hypothetical protein